MTTAQPESPRIYVASLSDYNAGILHGVWIDVEGMDADEIQEEVNEMLASSPTAALEGSVAEEWAIHDHEGFGSLRLSEWETFERVATIGNAIADADDPGAMAAWLDMTDGNEPEDFGDHFRGHWDSFKEYVTEDEIGDLFLGISELTALARNEDKMQVRSGYENMVDRLNGYIDWDAVANDLEADYTVIQCGAPIYGVWIFEDEV